MLLNGSDRFAIFNRERGNPQSARHAKLIRKRKRRAKVNLQM
jgi:hypothetical protein